MMESWGKSRASRIRDYDKCPHWRSLFHRRNHTATFLTEQLGGSIMMCSTRGKSDMVAAFAFGLTVWLVVVGFMVWGVL